MPNAIEIQLKERIHSFVTELDLLVRRSALDSLRGVLDSGAAVGRGGRGPGRPKGSGRASGNIDEAAEKVVAHVRAKDGQGIAAIADATGVTLKVAKKAAIQLLASGQLKKSGQKRGTIYHVGSGNKPRAKLKKAGKRRSKKTKAA